MTRLRDDVRNAFEREQTSLGEVGDARHRLLHQAIVNRDAAAPRGRQWTAGVAAVLIAAIVITTFALIRANLHSAPLPAATPSGSPKAQVSPTPLRNHLSVPDSTPILTYADPADQNQFDGITWDGRTAGVLDSSAHDAMLSGAPNPAANLFGNATDISDRTGRTVATGTFGVGAWFATWADDGTHFCYTSPFDTVSSAPTTLNIAAPGQAPRTVAHVGTRYNQTTVIVAACSVLTDRAVVVQTGEQGFAVQYWVVQLSTGNILWSHSFGITQTSVFVVASRDGMYVADNLLVQATPAGSTVYGPDGKSITHFSTWIEGFSWDGSLAVTDPGNGTLPVQVVEWRTGNAVFTAPTGFRPLRTAPEPGGDEIAIYALIPQQGTSRKQVGNLYVVNSSGKVFQITGAVPIP